MITITFLGTNGWYDTDTGNTISILVQTDDVVMVLDAGYGLAKLDRYEADGDKPVILFLSHYHLDHTVGLHTLLKFKFSAGLTICIPTGTKEILNTLVAPPFTAPLSYLPYPVRVLELPGEEHALLSPKVEARRLHHVTFTVGYRIETEGVTLAYVPDTGYCENAVLLARDADVLFAECAYPAGLSSEEWPHLNPETAARIAHEARVRRLYLVHFDAFQYPRRSDRSEAAKSAQERSSPTPWPRTMGWSLP